MLARQENFKTADELKWGKNVRKFGESTSHFYTIKNNSKSVLSSTSYFSFMTTPKLNHSAQWSGKFSRCTQSTIDL
jgi:hypothetical protein